MVMAMAMEGVSMAIDVVQIAAEAVVQDVNYKGKRGVVALLLRPVRTGVMHLHRALQQALCPVK